MSEERKREQHAPINPARRRDRPGEPHESLTPGGAEPDEERPRGYQEADLDPRDQSGIAE